MNAQAKQNFEQISKDQMKLNKIGFIVCFMDEVYQSLFASSKAIMEIEDATPEALEQLDRCQLLLEAAGCQVVRTIEDKKIVMAIQL